MDQAPTGRDHDPTKKGEHLEDPMMVTMDAKARAAQEAELKALFAGARSARSEATEATPEAKDEGAAEALEARRQERGAVLVAVLLVGLVAANRALSSASCAARAFASIVTIIGSSRCSPFLVGSWSRPVGAWSIVAERRVSFLVLGLAFCAEL